MAESTLSPTTTQRRREIAHFLGYGRKADVVEGLTVSKDADVSAIEAAGEARFAGAHDWVFLRPQLALTLWANASGTVSASGTTVTATAAKFFPSMIGHSIVIATVGTFTITAYTSSTVVTVNATATCTNKAFTIAADGIYRLPDDYGGLESTQIEFARASGAWPIINVVAVRLITQEWQISDVRARPTRAAPRVVANVGTGQRWDLIVDPVPDADYGVTFRYNALPNAMGTTDYAAGGMLFADAILKCCLAVAEEKYREGQTIMAEQEAKALAKAIAHDLKYGRGHRLGRTTTRNFDRADDRMDSQVTGFVYRGEAITVPQ
jgi:hypothetical protein